MFSNPRNNAAVMAAWESFLSGDAARNDTLRTLVDRSWRRCQDARVDPDRRYAPDPLPEHALYALRESNSELLEAGAPVMAYARDFLAESGTMMLLADTQCTILTMEGDTPTVDTAESIRLIPGVTWSEHICGTNAIGTALAVGQPVQIHSAEHFCAGIKLWTCSAAVIRHPQGGEIVGVIDVSGLSETYNRQSLALAVTTASRIESRLAAREMELRCRLLEGAMGRWGSSATDGLILFDRRGVPVKINEHATSAVAARGGDMDLSVPARLPEMALGADGPVGPLPEWMNNDWLVPVTSHGLRLGTLLIMPLARGARPASIQQATPNCTPPDSPAKVRNFASLVSRNPTLLSAIDKARQLARSKVPVLLLGETGVGKEEFARGIHEASQRASGAYVALNCGGLSRELLASELFGYAEGAFTGARKGGMMGKIEAADGGTLFLDEIGEMPIDLQPHLLRVLEEGEIHRLGENAPRKVNFRLVAATHRNLREEVAAGRFRMDLYYRLLVIPVEVPPLRDRREDIPALATHFVKVLSRQFGRRVQRISDATMRQLMAYDWPGNVRELENLLARAVVLSPGEILDAPLELGAAHGVPEASSPQSFPSQSLEDAERSHVERVLASTNWVVEGPKGAARILQMNPSTLRSLMKRLGIRRPQ